MSSPSPLLILAAVAALLTACGSPGDARHEVSAARWQPAGWADLPGFDRDRLVDAWPALQRNCTRPPLGWEAACAGAGALGAAPAEATIRDWMTTALQPWRIEAGDGSASGRLTGYYEPVLRASRTRTAVYTTPLYRPPDDLARHRPWYTRAQMQQDPAAQAALAGHEIAWVADPLEAMTLQVQGSGRLEIVDAAGRVTGTIRLAFAGHNDQPFKPLGPWLVQQGVARPGQSVGGDAIRQWAAANPARVQDLVAANPRVVFFREEPLVDPGVGPLGTQGLPLTPGRSVAVDPGAVPLGTPLWIDSTEPPVPAQGGMDAASALAALRGDAPGSVRPLQRLVFAQDTGSAIKGAVRADFFWGWDSEAEVQAHRTRQPLRVWALWPRG